MGMFWDNKQERLDRRVYKAIDAKNITKLKEALDAGGAIDAKGYWGWVYHAVNNNFNAALPLLLERGAPVDGRGPFGYTPLRMAANKGNGDAARLLLEAGAHINAADENGLTPLHGAAHAGKMDMIAFLLEQGADIAARDKHMNTPADIAAKEYPRIAEYLWQKMGINEEKTAEAALAEGWHLTGADEVAHVSEKPAIGYRFTDVFNFSAKLHTRIAANTNTHAESSSVRTFDEIEGSPLLEQAAAALRAHGGKPDAHMPEKPKTTPTLNRNGPKA